MVDDDNNSDNDGGDPSAPKDTTERVHEILEGTEALSTVAEAAAILADAEAVEAAISPIGDVLSIVGMGFMVWHALETPKRTLSYQGYSYGLVRACVGLPDPTPNPGWPDPGDVNNDYSNFDDAVAKAKSDLGNIKFKNRFLLEIAKNGPAAVLVAVWNAIIPDDDHLLRMLTPSWPDVSPG